MVLEPRLNVAMANHSSGVPSRENAGGKLKRIEANPAASAAQIRELAQRPLEGCHAGWIVQIRVRGMLPEVWVVSRPSKASLLIPERVGSDDLT